MDPDAQAATLAACVLVAGYLSYKCWTPPNPAPPTPYQGDRVGRWIISQSSLDGRRGFAIVFWLSRVALTLTYPHPPKLLCPHPENLSPDHFTWSPYIILCLSLIFVAAPIRLLAFAQLGNSFTFRLARPQTLITTGLYAYVQHPSYVTNMIVLLVNLVMMLAPGGQAGCWLPSVVMQWMGVVLLVLGGIAVWGMSVRVRDEEEMLRKEFGREWELYHAKTKRFLPVLF